MVAMAEESALFWVNAVIDTRKALSAVSSGLGTILSIVLIATNSSVILSSCKKKKKKEVVLGYGYHIYEGDIITR